MAATSLVHACILPLPATTAILRVVDEYAERYRLTKAEREVLAAVTVEGVPPRKVGLAFMRSEETTKTHVRNLLQKTKNGSFAELALAVMRDALHCSISSEMPRVTEAAHEEKTNLGEGSSECSSRAGAVARRRIGE